MAGAARGTAGRPGGGASPPGSGGPPDRPEPGPAAGEPPVRRDVGVVIPAAGEGVRFGHRKAFLALGGRPLVLHCLRAFAAVGEVLEIALAVPADDLEAARDRVRSWAGELVEAAGGRTPPRIHVVPGGIRRQDSVWEGIRALSERIGPVLVHDAARPLIRGADIRKVIAAIRETGAAVLGTPATDSVKAEEDGAICRELDRKTIWLVQTPQGATREILTRTFEEGIRAGREVTDEAGLLHAAGVRVRLIEGVRTNIKITFPEDLPLAEFLLKTLSF